jgi:hypothetical protein
LPMLYKYILIISVYLFSQSLWAKNTKDRVSKKDIFCMIFGIDKIISLASSSTFTWKLYKRKKKKNIMWKKLSSQTLADIYVYESTQQISADLGAQLEKIRARHQEEQITDEQIILQLKKLLQDKSNDPS